MTCTSAGRWAARSRARASGQYQGSRRVAGLQFALDLAKFGRVTGVAQGSVSQQPANVLAALCAGIVVHHQGGHMVELEVDREAENHGLQQRRDDEHEHDAPVAHRLADLLAHDRAQLHRPAWLSPSCQPPPKTRRSERDDGQGEDGERDQIGPQDRQATALEHDPAHGVHEVARRE